MDYSLTISYNAYSVPQGLTVIGGLKMKNRCCTDKPVLITKTNGHDVYSCQCSCGGWCTNGYKAISDAVREYEEMSM